MKTYPDYVELPVNRCPLVGVGDTISMGTVVEVRGTYRCWGICKAYKCIALLILDNSRIVNPANVRGVDCEQCPRLKENPKSEQQSKSFEDLVREAEGDIVQETKESSEQEEPTKPKSRFNIIEIEEET